MPDGRAVAVKVADGGGRASTPVTVAALRSLGVDVAVRRRARAGVRPRRPGGSTSARWSARRERAPGPSSGRSTTSSTGASTGSPRCSGGSSPRTRRSSRTAGRARTSSARARSPSIDPGPLLDAHRDALAAAVAGERVTAICVTHCHSDHSPLAAWLKEETGAPTSASVRIRRPESRRRRRGEGRGGRRPRLRPRRAHRRRRARRVRTGVDDQRRAHARSHVEPHVLRRRRARRAVPRRPRDGVEHDGGLAARRRHGGLRRVAAQGGRPAAATAPTGRRMARRSPSRSATSKALVEHRLRARAAGARRRCGRVCDRSPTSSPCSTPTSRPSCTSRLGDPSSPTSSSSSTRATCARTPDGYVAV